MASLTFYQALILGGSARFVQRIEFIINKYARECTVAAGNTTPGRESSKRLARVIMSDSHSSASKIALSICTHPDVVAADTSGSGAALDSQLTDTQLDALVRAAWDATVWDNLL